MTQQTNQISLRVTVHAGPRTKIKVSAYSISVNEKHLKFANGETVTSTSIEKWLEESLESALKKLAGEVTK